ncbi:NDR1/HIN1-like protein 10 isoform X2 [Daucus carota subsp. sativus]|uniref:NDR1/HIN1-like protein 10 isoform X2 n=1 Tax=Daucus carota subsp. sativus TaxID=79200 RepID=UPI0007EF5C73|nr:PREDICTED: protein YLS9-like [Daucus carota subsp. sativus]XP_017248436.1 PREDICTED: protein YLS9-like [Daucus carota subsp. sativus]XP_017248437.1 PREDICTED: protein YLS9-like [Daucus carota subsp. sativus]
MPLHRAAAATFLGGAGQQPPATRPTTDRQQYNRITKVICTCVRDIMLALIIALICIAFISIIASLIIRPRSPRFTVISAAIAGVNVTGSEFKAACNLSVLAHNPNTNLVIWYRKLEVLLLYGSDYELSGTTIAPMFQSKRNQTVISARLVSDDVDVDNDVVEGVASELRRGVITFRVRVLAGVRFKRGKWVTKKYKVKADCDGIDIGVLNATGTGNLIEPGIQCEGSARQDHDSWTAALKLTVTSMVGVLLREVAA